MLPITAWIFDIRVKCSMDKKVKLIQYMLAQRKDHLFGIKGFNLSAEGHEWLHIQTKRQARIKVAG